MHNRWTVVSCPNKRISTTPTCAMYCKQEVHFKIVLRSPSFNFGLELWCFRAIFYFLSSLALFSFFDFIFCKSPFCNIEFVVDKASPNGHCEINLGFFSRSWGPWTFSSRVLNLGTVGVKTPRFITFVWNSEYLFRIFAGTSPLIFNINLPPWMFFVKMYEPEQF